MVFVPIRVVRRRCISESMAWRNHSKFLAKRQAIDSEMERLLTTRIGTNTMAELLRRPEVQYANLPSRDDSLSSEVIQQIEIGVKYRGYIDRQELEVAKFKTLEDKQIPAWLNYDTVHSLRPEARQKLTKIRPITLGQASRISGVSPSDISLLMVWMKRGPTTTPSQAKDQCAAAEHQDEASAHNSCCGDL